MLALTMSITLTMLITLCWSSQAQFIPIDTIVAQYGTGNFARVTDTILAAPNFSAQFYIWIKEGLCRDNHCLHSSLSRDGTRNFTRLTDAILAAPNFSARRRFYIWIKEGLYRENIFVGEEKTNLTLFGDGMDKTIISVNKSNAEGLKTFDTATAGIHGLGFVTQDITFENTAGPYMNQAIALRSEANNSAFYRCRFRGYQDTLYTKVGIQFFSNCEIYSTIDFIFGDATVNLTFKTFLGRPWGNLSTTIVMQSYLDDIIDPKGWLEWNGRSPDRVYYVEYNNSGPGANTQGRVKWAKSKTSFIDKILKIYLFKVTPLILHNFMDLRLLLSSFIMDLRLLL
ncbi:hypothetical protein LOK49_LG15G02271 [Camellia lanceoleosa]|uniref:Uncharacterized protein n=1 Tax=Camellia lanceoleosa TaxID=1840588 RepID=A0ACC0F4T4_9ERIC|nr:hypothetical protein LOK49_LG15G02271 [Camellia lanceoleosa]